VWTPGAYSKPDAAAMEIARDEIRDLSAAVVLEF
jgi:hypothetical protein